MLSVVEENQYKVKLENIDLKEVFIEILTSFYDEFTNKNIQPKIEICNENINILGDYIGVKRVIENIMINISKHSKNQISITLLKINNKVELNIIDTLDDKEEIDAANLFTKFYKSDKLRSVNSTGLGLSIIKELMDKMNGDISAYIRDNKLYIKCMWNFNENINL